jgi:hypothetical protein
MTKRKPKAKPKPNRSRGVAIQVYVSREERGDIRQIARKRGVTLSTLVRDWIRRSAAAVAAAAEREPKPPAADPRQISLLAACPDCPLAHVGIHDASCPMGLPPSN